MGLFYSILSYVYPKQKFSPQKIQLSAMKMSKTIQLKQKKLQQENIKKQNQFIQSINIKSTHLSSRTKQIQIVQLNAMIQLSIQFGVFQQLYKCAERIKNEAFFIAQDQSKMSNQCLKSIFAIVHLYKQFQLHTIIDLKEFIPQPYPTISIDKLDENMQQYLKYKEPTNYQRNLYVLQLISKYKPSITLQKINEIGHQFVYNPIRQKQKQVFSTQLYARSIQNFQVMENQQFAV